VRVSSENLYAYNFKILNKTSRSQWPHGLRRGSVVSYLLGLRVRTLPEAWMSVCCESCVLSYSVPCNRPIPRTERVCACVCVCERERERVCVNECNQVQQ
jgi:hypothetical protein